MVNFEERIARMESTGTITPEQAAELLASTRASYRHGTAGTRRKFSLGAVLGISIAVLAVVLFFALNFQTGSGEVQTVSEMMNEPDEVGAMNKNISVTMSLFVILLPIVLSVLGFVWINNNLVDKEEAVLASWSQVESNYQRRADLVPNLVETVKSFAEHEKTLLTDITRERSLTDLDQAVDALARSQQRAGELTTDARDKLDDDGFMRTLAAAQNTVDEHMTRLFGLVENYPQLRSSDNFLALQDQLEGTENRVNVARMVFNDSVRAYNSAIRKLPASLVAGLGDFARKAYFEADEGADTPVNVELGTSD